MEGAYHFALLFEDLIVLGAWKPREKEWRRLANLVFSFIEKAQFDDEHWRGAATMRSACEGVRALDFAIAAGLDIEIAQATSAMANCFEPGTIHWPSGQTTEKSKVFIETGIARGWWSAKDLSSWRKALLKSEKKEKFAPLCAQLEEKALELSLNKEAGKRFGAKSASRRM